MQIDVRFVTGKSLWPLTYLFNHVYYYAIVIFFFYSSVRQSANKTLDLGICQSLGGIWCCSCSIVCSMMRHRFASPCPRFGNVNSWKEQADGDDTRLSNTGCHRQISLRCIEYAKTRCSNLRIIISRRLVLNI
jgi:hypothetical protein